MRLYMVRHGESEDNASNIHQTPENPLSKTGEEQTVALANRFENIKNLDLIISSPFMRAKQTAEAISNKTGLEITYSDLAVERKMPSETLGKPWHGEETRIIDEEIYAHKQDSSWHFSDEENFSEQKTRALKLIDLIESYGEKNLLLVSHGHFIRLVVCLLMFGKELTSKEHDIVESFMKTKNTGITVCERKNDKWDMITWNDHAHLG